MSKGIAKEKWAVRRCAVGWLVIHNVEGSERVPPDWEVIAECREEQHAYLMAAAPKMAATLKSMLACYDAHHGHVEPSNGNWAAARAILAEIEKEA